MYTDADHSRRPCPAPRRRRLGRSSIAASISPTPRKGEQAYLESHIPGARYAHLDRDLSGRQDRAQRPPSAAGRRGDAGAFGALGIGPGVQVVAYDADSGMYAARLWWMLRFMGHDAVARAGRRVGALDARGPCDARRTRAVAPGDVHRRAARGVARRRGRGVEPVWTIRRRCWSTPGRDRFRGENETLDAKAGHIPGARNFFFQRNLADDKTFRPAEQLASRLAGGAGGGVAGRGGDVLRVRRDRLPQPAGAGARGPRVALASFRGRGASGRAIPTVRSPPANSPRHRRAPATSPPQSPSKQGGGDPDAVSPALHARPRRRPAQRRHIGRPAAVRSTPVRRGAGIPGR